VALALPALGAGQSEGAPTPTLGKTVVVEVLRGKVSFSPPRSAGGEAPTATPTPSPEQGGQPSDPPPPTGGTPVPPVPPLPPLPPPRARAAQSNFAPLTGQQEIPVGSRLDTRRGTVKLTSAVDATKTQSAELSGGVFEVRQSDDPDARGLTELRLEGVSFARCRSKGKRAEASRKKRRRLSPTVINRLSAEARGRFRTRGRLSSAVVRGTVWTTADRCDGTLTSVDKGSVTVRDFRVDRTVIVQAGESYLARAQ
jgi:hypothetical protein